MTCSFTVAPSPTPKPTPKPTPTPTPDVAPGLVGDVQATAEQRVHRPDLDRAGRHGDRSRSTPTRPAARPTAPTTTCRRRSCPASQRAAVVDQVDNGTSYACEVAAVSAVGAGPWTPADAAVTPAGPPAAPAGVNADSGDRSAVVHVAAGQRRRGADHRLPLRVQRRRRRDLAARRRPGLGRDIDHGRRPRRTAPPTPAAPRPRTPRASARRRPPRARSCRAPTRSSATRPSAGSCSASSTAAALAAACVPHRLVSQPPAAVHHRLRRRLRGHPARPRAAHRHRLRRQRDPHGPPRERGRPGPVQGIEHVRRPVGRGPHRRQGRRGRRCHRSRR